MRTERRDENELKGAQKMSERRKWRKESSVVVEIVEGKGIAIRGNKRERRWQG